MNEPTVTTDELARRAAVLAVLAKRVGQARDQVAAQLAERLTVGDVKKPSHPVDDRVRLATVSYALGRQSAGVTNSRALDAWVAEHHPEHIEPRVSEAYLAAILATTKRVGEPCTPEGELDVPGVGLSTSEPSISVRPATDVPDAAWLSLLGEVAREVTRG